MGWRLWLIEQRADHIGPRSSAKGSAPRRHLIKHYTEGEDVAAMIYLLTASLLRRHRSGRAHHHSRHGHVRLGLTIGPLQQLRQSEVENFRLPARCDHDVSSFDVAVDYS